jgi:hypothetical protein
MDNRAHGKTWHSLTEKANPGDEKNLNVNISLSYQYDGNNI